jgi:orotidine-5'-phosphate decarboxylase
MTAITKYNTRVNQANSLLCVGLDSDINKLPSAYATDEHPQFAFNRHIIEQTHTATAAYKFNMAFYEARGAAGIQELALSVDYLRQNHPDILTICDAKRSDIGNTSKAYADAIFEEIGFDSVTLNPYLGRDAIMPFLAYEDKACIILCRTSNNGSGEFQNLQIDGTPLWQVVAQHVANEWNTNNNCMLVVGATYPDQIAQVRNTVGDMTLLVPGIGAQGGDLASVMNAGLNSENNGLIINSSRDIIFSDDPAQSAQTLRDSINQFRA